MDSNSDTHLMPLPIRILFAEDSETMRRLVTFVFSSDAEFEICQTVQNGREAVDAFREHEPDVVLMDVEMPVMNGIEATAAIRRLNSRVPIIMFTSLAIPDTEATIDALTSGATDFVIKPATCGHLDSAFQFLRNDLVRKIKCWGHWFQRKRLLSSVAAALETPVDHESTQDAMPDENAIGSNAGVDVVAIGVSSGGPNALATLLKDLPGDFPVPILITQHMPSPFTKLLAERLSRLCPLEVREASTGVLLEPGHIWIAPGDDHLLARRHSAGVRLQVHHGPPENSCRPSVDVMFRSIADAYHDRSLAVVLTGLGHDGMQGCRKIRDFGGHVLAQDETSSIVWGMPRAVIKAGLAERAVPLSDMAVEIARLAACGRKPVASAQMVAT